MQVKKIKVRKISVDELFSIISPLLEEYNWNKEYLYQTFQNKFIFRFTSEFDQIEIIDKNEKIDEVLNELAEINLYPYSIGEPIIRIEKGKVYPLLPLANYLSICNKIYLKNTKMAEKLTYGKAVIVNINEIITQGPLVNNAKYLVYSQDGLFIAFSRVKIKKNFVKILPDLDIGWYLRKGK